MDKPTAREDRTVKKASAIMLSALLLFALGSCGIVHNDKGGRAGINRVNTNSASRPLRVSMDAARSVETLIEVQSALVVISNQDAFVSVRLEGGGNMRAQGQLTNDKGHRGENKSIFGIPDYRGYGVGTQTGEYSGTGIGGGSIDGLAFADLPESGKSFGAGDGAEISRQPNSASPMIVLDSSYPGISDSLKQNIAEQIQNVEQSIQRVYLSFNRAFYMRMNRLADDINNGRKDAEDDFRKMVQASFATQYPLNPVQ